MYASTRVSSSCEEHALSPWLVTPARCSEPIRVRKAGPPESPEQGCDGAGASANVVGATDVTLAVPARFCPASVALDVVVPKPTTRIVAPASVESGEAARGATGAAGAI